jgi:glycosyltransferase involved in cell wall biosynthesis
MTAGSSGKKSVSIVIPAWNESEVLDELATRLSQLMDRNPKYQFEIIIVENGSWDDSWQKLTGIRDNDPRFKIIQLTRNFTADGAVQAALGLATGDAAIMMDADLQDPPELINKFLIEWEAGAEIVYGAIERRQGVSIIKRVLARAYYGLMGVITDGAIPANVTGFRLMDRIVYTTMNQMSEHNRFTRGLSVWGGFKVASIPFTRPARFAGKTKSPFSHLMREAWDGIYGFSDLPLRLPFYAGWLAFVAATIAGGFLWSEIIDGAQTNTALAISVLVLGLFGILFFLIGFFGAYIRLILDEVRNRPGFIIRKSQGFQSESDNASGPSD